MKIYLLLLCSRLYNHKRIVMFTTFLSVLFLMAVYRSKPFIKTFKVHVICLIIVSFIAVSCRPVHDPYDSSVYQRQIKSTENKETENNTESMPSVKSKPVYSSVENTKKKNKYGMKFPKGLKISQLMSSEVTNNEERIARLETAVLMIDEKLDMIAKSISERKPYPVAFDKPLNIGATNKKSSAPEHKIAQHKNPPKKEIKNEKQASDYNPKPDLTNISETTALKAIRIGNHNDFIRIVFDLNRKSDYRIDIDNEEKLLFVEFPEAVKSKEINNTTNYKNSLISSSKIEEQDTIDGLVIVFLLSDNVKIIRKESLPSSDNKSFRVFVDISASNK